MSLLQLKSSNAALCPRPSPNNCKWPPESCTMKPPPPRHPETPSFQAPVSQLLLSQLPQHSVLPLASGPLPMLSVPCSTHTTLAKPPQPPAPGLPSASEHLPSLVHFPVLQLKGHFLQEPRLTPDKDRYSAVCPQSILPIHMQGGTLCLLKHSTLLPLLLH